MRTGSEMLWKLINSMTSAEKLYFRRNYLPSGTAKDSLYLQLFNAIDAQKKYDETALIKKFSPSITRKNLPAQKHYLYNHVCNALLYCDTRDNATQEIYRDIQLVRMFRKKGLLDEAHDLWKKTVVKARSSEAFALLNLLKAEFGKMILFSGNQTRDEELHSIFKGNIISYDEYTEMMNLRDIYTEVLLLKRKAHYDIDEPLRDRIDTLMRRVEISEKNYPGHSFWFRHYQKMNKATLLYLLNEPARSLQLLDAVWIDWKNHEDYLSSESEFFIEVLYMINYSGILDGKFGYVESVFDDPVNASIGHAQRANFEAVKFLALNKIYNKTAQYGKVEKLVSFVKSKYRSWEPMMNADMNRTLTLSVGIASLVLENHNDAIYFIKKAISEYNKGGRQEQAAVGQLLLLLAAWHLNNARYFDAQYKSAYNYFYKHQKKRPFETIIMQCLQKSFYVTDRKEKLAAFRSAVSQLEMNANDQIQKRAFNIFNFQGWLNANLERIPYRQYVQRHLQQYSPAV